MGCGLSKAHIHSEVLVAHANARTTFHGRQLIVDRHRAGWPQAQIAAAMGISRGAVKSHVARAKDSLRAALGSISARPSTNQGRSLM